MACIRHMTCTECNNEFMGDTHSSNSVCSKCTKTKLRLEKESHFKFLDTLTIEQRIRKIEEWQYHFDNNILPNLERVGIRFA